jgi:hypothetical protein
MIFRALCLAALLLFARESRAEPAPNIAAPPKLIIYLAKGAENTCGPGCDRWIAIEGVVDRDAAARVEQFLRGVKDVQRPVYLHSPGGVASQAYSIARMLRARKATARVGKTVADACPGAQADDACIMLKTNRDELRASIATRNAICNSACADMLFGATTREVAPDATLGVHSSKIVMEFKRFVTERQHDEAMARTRERGDREHREFIESMGINRELFDLIATVSFERNHPLTRDELHRFNIDTRDFGETGWTLETTPRPAIAKSAFAKIGGRLRGLEWRLTCDGKDRVRLAYAREFDRAVTGLSTLVKMAGPEAPPSFSRYPARIGPADVWITVIAADAIKNLFSVPVLIIGESRLMPDGTSSRDYFEIKTSGLDAAWTKMSALCARSPSGTPGSALLAPPPRSMVFPTPRIASPQAADVPKPVIAPPAK